MTTMTNDTITCNISVVVPTFNRAATIGYCLSSVLNQTLSPQEVIIVDDHSTDETVEIVKSYADPRIRCIVLENNSGAQAARNRGILEAKGEWIAFQDSDDEWVAEKLEKQVDILRKHDFSSMTVVYTDCWRTEASNKEMRIWKLPTMDGSSSFQQLLTSHGPMFQGLLTSKVALLKIGLLDEKVPSFQEWDTSIRLAKECLFLHISEPLFIYHLHDSDRISNDRKRDIEGYQYIVDKFRDDILRYCGAEVLNAHLINNSLKAMHWGYYDDAATFLGKCIGRPKRVVLLTWMIKMKVKRSYYDRIMGLCRRLKLIS